MYLDEVRISSMERQISKLTYLTALTARSCPWPFLADIVLRAGCKNCCSADIWATGSISEYSDSSSSCKSRLSWLSGPSEPEDGKASRNIRSNFVLIPSTVCLMSLVND